MKIRPEVTTYTCHLEYLNDMYAYLKLINRRCSLAIWSQKLGLKSKAGLSMVLSGKRLPSDNLITRIADHLKFTSREKAYFRSLIIIQRFKKRESQDNHCLSIL